MRSLSLVLCGHMEGGSVCLCQCNITEIKDKASNSSLTNMIITTGDKYLSWTPARANKWAALSAHYPSSGLQDTQNPSSRKAKVTSNASMSYLYRTVRNPKSRYHCLQQTFLSSFVSWMDWRDILYILFPCLPVSLKENYSFSFYLKNRETETRRELLFPSSLCKCPSQSGLGQPKPGAGHLIWDTNYLCHYLPPPRTHLHKKLDGK